MTMEYYMPKIVVTIFLIALIATNPSAKEIKESGIIQKLKDRPLETIKLEKLDKYTVERRSVLFLSRPYLKNKITGESVPLNSLAFCGEIKLYNSPTLLHDDNIWASSLLFFFVLVFLPSVLLHLSISMIYWKQGFIITALAILVAIIGLSVFWIFHIS